jgi:hypothetical protein
MTSRCFTADELALFLADARLFSRDFAIYVLGLRLGLSAEQISILDIGHVSTDGVWVRPEVVVPGRLSSRARAFRRHLPRDVRGELSRYLTWRCRWLDFRQPLITYDDPAGVQRCEVCQSEQGLLDWPLFSDWRGRRLSARDIRTGFGANRDRLGLDRRLRFDSLRAARHTAAPVEAPEGPR